MKRLLAILLVLAMCLPANALAAEVHIIADETALPAGWAEKELFRITVIDTDRSDAMLLECGGEKMMVDGGLGTYYRRVFKVLDDKGITELKYLYNTHYDGDHLMGLTAIMNSGLYQVGSFLSAVREDYKDKYEYHVKAVRAARKRGIPYVQIYDGDVITLGDATLSVLRCDENWGANNRSAACLVQFGESRLFLSGDCGNQVLEYFLENRDHALLKCDIMKAMHHGINGIVQEFLDVAQPELMFVPNKSSNVKKSPNLKQFIEMGALFSGDGMIVMETDGTEWYVWQYPNWVD
ncbi:MAG: MBL fold metallo-hydrolase [Clostridia bacterium]|nr:MBL fold metallo-hydrolase [Clostridia bacterium]